MTNLQKQVESVLEKYTLFYKTGERHESLSQKEI
jgi:hypothetical protein